MKNQTGLTLVELLVTTAIMAIILTAAVPAFKGLFESKNIPQIATMFEKVVKLARSEAINRNSEINVKPHSGTGDWSQGWYIEQVITDGDDDTPDDLELIRTFPAVSGNPTFTSEDYNDSNGFKIRANGQLSGAPGSFTLKSPTNCAAGSYTLSLLVSGSIKKVEDSCS